ncbi:unnamed protein product [Didymodactylos carnosus]|uniref:Uncharacterized protein n=1 Tax=Didymodactylos carnosus TaxID=1234261 RepID=A0A815GFU8_9BILA|nr:unnamed protein product [Didymodactylos carnosus]CAF1339043.1 unnamed protein product [Didymodactylos carnosus]CAF3795385.1 unnamed protein product [Didymodactylos carnosus]CAF4198311.1 unnamed protein product [Didymodactylos carnosus]
MSYIIRCSAPSCVGGIGIFSCQGCGNVFCKRHTYEHHQQLAQELDEIIQEHSLLRTQLQLNDEKGQNTLMSSVLSLATSEYSSNSLLDQIDKWESDSKRAITQAADEARTKVHFIINENKLQLIKDFLQLSNEITERRESEDFVETDLIKWRRKFRRIKDELNMPKYVKLETNPLLMKNMIKVVFRRRQSSEHISSNVPENFEKYCGFIKLEDNGQSAVHTGNFDTDGSVYGTKSYSNGVHRIPLRIEKMQGVNWMFFGIISSSFSTIRVDACAAKSAYGWAATDKTCALVYLQGTELNGIPYGFDGDICRNDRIELILNCDQKKIQILNKRTNKQYQLSVSTHHCPLPWKLVVSLYSPGDRVRLL